MNKKIIAAACVIVAVFIASYFFMKQSTPESNFDSDTNVPNETDNTMNTTPHNTPEPAATELKIETIKQGSGAGAVSGNTVTVHYTGTLAATGVKFDSSRDRGEPFSFVLGAGKVIQGWDRGLLGMKAGEQRTLTIPPALGYGPSDYGPIPGNSTLIFDVEMIAIQ